MVQGSCDRGSLSVAAFGPIADERPCFRQSPSAEPYANAESPRTGHSIKHTPQGLARRFEPSTALRAAVSTLSSTEIGVAPSRAGGVFGRSSCGTCSVDKAILKAQSRALILDDPDPGSLLDRLLATQVVHEPEWISEALA